MEKEFPFEAECRDYLRSALADEPPCDDSRAAVESAVLDVFVQSSKLKPRGFGASIGTWVIKDGDLDLFGSVRAGAIALSSGKIFAGSLEIAVITALLFAIVSLLRNAYRRGARLPRGDVEVLGTLVQSKRPLTAGEIVDLLTIDDREPRTLTDVEAALHRLAAVQTKAGAVKLVEETRPGSWISSDV